MDDNNPIKLLLVDDEPGYVSVLAKRMAKRNIDAVTATNGNEAIQTLRSIRFDCAVLDLKMEDMDGIEVLKIFKKMDPDMPVIMLTGHGSETAAREGVKFGAFDYLTKPCDLDDLIRIICDACKREAS
ncbi:MAG: response regulator [Deltaproteobacteria bacterium]|nr:response regulator [Deltaproteobacteria bacterium]